MDHLSITISVEGLLLDLWVKAEQALVTQCLASEQRDTANAMTRHRKMTRAETFVIDFSFPVAELDAKQTTSACPGATLVGMMNNAKSCHAGNQARRGSNLSAWRNVKTLAESDIGNLSYQPKCRDIAKNKAVASLKVGSKAGASSNLAALNF